MTHAQRKEWRCFHCDEVFADRREAALHFGANEFQEPICLILDRNDRDLLKVLRDAERSAEEVMGQLHSESTDLHNAYRNLQARYGAAVSAAEMRGYENGLRDHLGTIVSIVRSCPGNRVVVPPAVQEILPKLKLWRYRDDFTGGEVYEAVDADKDI